MPERKAGRVGRLKKTPWFYNEWGGGWKTRWPDAYASICGSGLHEAWKFLFGEPKPEIKRLRFVMRRNPNGEWAVRLGYFLHVNATMKELPLSVSTERMAEKMGASGPADTFDLWVEYES